MLKQIGRISGGDTDKKLSVQNVTEDLELDRTEIKNFLDYIEGLGYIEIVTIGAPLLYGHAKITEMGVKKVCRH